MTTVFIAAGSGTGMGGASHLHTFSSIEDATRFVIRAKLMTFNQPQYIANQAGAVEWGIYPCELAEVDDALNKLLNTFKGD